MASFGDSRMMVLVELQVVDNLTVLSDHHMRSGLFCASLLCFLLNPVSFALQFPFTARSTMAVESTKLDPINYPQAPSNLTLEQVHVYVRHGELSLSCTMWNIR